MTAAIDLALEVTDAGGEAVVLDMRRLRPSPMDLHAGLSELHIDRSEESPAALLRRLATSGRLRHEEPRRVRGGGQDEFAAFLAAAFIADPGSRDDGFGGLLFSGLAGWLATQHAWESEPDPSRFGRAVRRQVRGFLDVYGAIRATVAESSLATQVVVWNGRVAALAATWAAANDAGCDTTFYEVGSGAKGRFWYGTEPPHDREYFQRHLLVEYANASSGSKDAIALRWLTANRTDTRQNQYLSGDAEDPEDARSPAPGPCRRATFFTSSPDEFIGVPGDWSTGDWVSQEQAFVTAAQILRKRGVWCTLRIHPNTANKSWRELRRMFCSLGREWDDVILPSDAVNSYRLIAESDAVFVWGSTIGVEAVAMGIPTYVLGATSYDLIADVRHLHSVKEVVRAVDELEYEVDTRSAYPYSYWRAEGGNRRLLPEVARFLPRLDAYEERRARFVRRTSFLRLLDLPRALRRSPAASREVLTRLLGARRASAVTRRIEHRMRMRAIQRTPSQTSSQPSS